MDKADNLHATQITDLPGYHQQHQEGVALDMKNIPYNTYTMNMLEVTIYGLKVIYT